MTKPHPDEDKYVLAPENVQCAMDMVDALAANDMEKVNELAKKLILPLRTLKGNGKEFVLRKGLPTITAEIANDTDWLK